MLKELKLNPTEYTPEVSFDPGSGQLSISGRSMPEDIGGFFNPLQEWIGSYVRNPNDSTQLRIYFEYYNSSTARRLTEIIFELEQLLDKGKRVKVIWCYKKGDSVMKENGEEIRDVIEIPFELEEI